MRSAEMMFWTAFHVIFGEVVNTVRNNGYSSFSVKAGTEAVPIMMPSHHFFLIFLYIFGISRDDANMFWRMNRVQQAKQASGAWK